MTKDLHSDPAEPAPDPLEAGRSMARRLALLHMAYARTLVDALGDEAGQALIRRAIAAYGAHVGERVRRSVEALGLEPTPANYAAGDDVPPSLFPSRSVEVDGEARSRSGACPLCAIWREYGEEALGGLYCGVDPAKMEAYNPAWTMVHTRRQPLGDPYCEFAIRPTGAQDE
ncbi:MAG: L-2-amino-thiazoline-4-carboxylic acid hydrolase [Chloroflexi bacterium]|nr:L-2-amino-thiazoline-4-carboxylic acid hydrolase [Chloroflexota bacterium]